MSHREITHPDALRAIREQLERLLWEAFEAGHFTWPTPHEPTRGSMFKRWFANNQHALAAVLDRPAPPVEELIYREKQNGKLWILAKLDTQALLHAPDGLATRSIPTSDFEKRYDFIHTKPADRPAQARPFNWPPDKGSKPSKWCAKDDKESHGWCMIRDASECHCTCNCHKRAESRPAPPVEDHKAAVEDMLAFGRGCKHDALVAKDREQYQFWGGYSAAMERIIALLTASRPAPEPAPLQNDPVVTRVEVVDESGRQYTRRNCRVALSYQDDFRTLKVFVNWLAEALHA